MIDAVVWGLVQGLTEFLPVSSSGHLVLVPAILEKMGVGIDSPGLAVSAVLHLGTLVAVLAYYRADLLRLLRAPLDPRNRRVITLLIIGTIPALIGLPLESALKTIENNPRMVALALIATGVVLWFGSRARLGTRTIDDARPWDAVIIGLAQATALIPGMSRSGTTITAGVYRDLAPEEAARFSFLLAIPAIAGGGLLSLVDLQGSSMDGGTMAVGLVVAAVSGYAAIAFLIRLLVRRGFMPFVVYCLVAGVIAFVVL